MDTAHCLYSVVWVLKFKRNILCSTRFSVVERARMSHAVNWKMPNINDAFFPKLLNVSKILLKHHHCNLVFLLLLFTGIETLDCAEAFQFDSIVTQLFLLRTARNSYLHQPSAWRYDQKIYVYLRNYRQVSQLRVSDRRLSESRCRKRYLTLWRQKHITTYFWHYLDVQTSVHVHGSQSRSKHFLLQVKMRRLSCIHYHTICKQKRLIYEERTRLWFGYF